MLLGMYADRNWGGRGPKFSTAGGILLAAAIGLLFSVLPDAPDLSRQATITDQAITSFGNAGMHSSMESWPLKDLLWVRIYPPEEFGRPFGAMEIKTRRRLGIIGIPATVSTARIAEILHGLGVQVILTGWQPTLSSPEQASAQGLTTMPGPGLPRVSARIDQLPEHEAGQILTPARLRFCYLLALGPLVICVLVALGLFGSIGFHRLIQRVLLGREDLVVGFAGLAILIGGFWFTSRLANLAPSLYLRSVARSVIECRPDALFDPRGDQVVYVDVVPRENWGKVMLKEFRDIGLLKVDEVSRSIQFEGDLERWRIPVASLISAEVESYRPAGQVEGRENPEIMYMTVIKARVGETIWEAPVRKCHVELKPKNNRLRESNAIAIRDQIRTLLPPAPG